MDPTDLTDSSKPDNPKEQDKTKKSGHAALPPDRAHRSSDPLPDLNPGMPPKPKPIIKRKKSQFGRRRKKRSRTREAWEQHQMEQQQGPDLGSAQEEEDTEPDPGRDEAGELLGPFLRGLPNEGPDGDGLGPDPDLGPDEEDEEGEGTEPDPGRRRDEALLHGSDPGRRRDKALLHGLPNEGGGELPTDPGGDGLGPDPDLGPDEEDEEGEDTEAAGYNIAAAATRRTDHSADTVRRLRAEKKALSLRLRYAERKIERRALAVERATSAAEKERTRAAKLKQESASLRAKTSTMKDEVARLNREANQDKKAVRKIIIAKDAEVQSSIRKINTAKASAVAQAQREQEMAEKRATAAESALCAAEQSAEEDKATLLEKLNKERRGQEAVVTHLRAQLARRSQSSKALKLKVAEQRKAVSAGNRTIKRTVRQHGDELRSAIERLRKRLELKDKKLHLDRITNEERLVNYIL